MATGEAQSKVAVTPNLKHEVALAKDQEEGIKTNHLHLLAKVKQGREALDHQIKATEDLGQGQHQYQRREEMGLVPGDKAQDEEIVILRKLEAQHLEARESSRSAAVGSVLSLSVEEIQGLDFLLLVMRTQQVTQ